MADNCGNPGHWKVNCPLLAEAKKEYMKLCGVEAGADRAGPRPTILLV